jgi:glycerol transport system ATP-binding protein
MAGAKASATRCSLGKGYGPVTGKVEIGVRPEFVKLANDGGGLPVKYPPGRGCRPPQDRPRRDLRQNINAIIAEDARSARHDVVVRFDPAGVNVYSDDWRVAPKGEAA